MKNLGSPFPPNPTRSAKEIPGFPFSSYLERFSTESVRQAKNKAGLEQYTTPFSIIKKFFVFGPDLFNRSLLDLGCGVGALSLSAILCGAKKVIGIDSDANSLLLAAENSARLAQDVEANINRNDSGVQVSSATTGTILLESCKSLSWIQADIEFCSLKNFRKEVDLVLMNPPFGTKRMGIDFVFLRRALAIGCPVLSMHKNSGKLREDLTRICHDFGFRAKIGSPVNFPLFRSLPSHKKEKYAVAVCFLYAE